MSFVGFVISLKLRACAGEFLNTELGGVFATHAESVSTRICHLEILFDIVESACRYTLMLHVHVTRDKR